MITYNEILGGIAVLLDRKRVGIIQRVGDGWQYQPKGAKVGGEILPTVSAVKQSIEAE